MQADQNDLQQQKENWRLHLLQLLLKSLINDLGWLGYFVLNYFDDYMFSSLTKKRKKNL